MLDTYETNQGIGASGLNFFNVPGAPSQNDALEYMLKISLFQAFELLESDDFAEAFGNSTNVFDYHWGKLHRISFSHPLGDSLSVPNGLFGLSTVDGLAGVARSGFMFSSGPARRFVAEMTSAGILAEQIVPGGQSGVITSGAAYINQLVLWLVNGYLPLITDLDTIVAIANEVYNFEP